MFSMKIKLLNNYYISPGPWRNPISVFFIKYKISLRTFYAVKKTK